MCFASGSFHECEVIQMEDRERDIVRAAVATAASNGSGEPGFIDALVMRVKISNTARRYAIRC